MPSWRSEPSLATNKLLTTQDFADIYAWLQTQSK